MNEQFEMMLGAKKDPKDNRDYRMASITQPVEIPVLEFELPELFPPKMQWSRGSCTSQAQNHHKERQEQRPGSARFTMALTKDREGNKDYGAYTRNTFVITNDYGVCLEEKFPEPGSEMYWDEYINAIKIPQDCYVDAKKHKSQSFWRIDNNIDSIKQAIWQNKNSIVMSMAWYTEFNSPTDGVLPLVFSGYVGGHAVEICGFNDNKQLLKVKNSWGKSWGKDGFFYLPYSIFSKIVWDLWSSLDIPVNVPVDNRYDMARNYAGEKATAFNPWLLRKLKRLPNNREINGLYYGKYEYEAVFQGKYGDIWLKITKPEAIKNGLIKK